MGKLQWTEKFPKLSTETNLLSTVHYLADVKKL